MTCRGVCTASSPPLPLPTRRAPSCSHPSHNHCPCQPAPAAAAVFSKGKKGASPSATAQDDSAHDARGGSAPLVGCIASVLRIHAAHLISLEGALFDAIGASGGRAPLGSRDPNTPAAATGDDDDETGGVARLSDDAVRIRAELIAARRELVPALCRACQLGEDRYLHEHATELLLVVLGPLARLGHVANGGRDDSGDGGDDDDEEDEEGWLQVAQQTALDSVRNLIGVLARGETLPGPSSDEPPNASLCHDDSNPFSGEGEVPRWLTLLVGLLSPHTNGMEAVARQHGLATLLSAPHEAAPQLRFLAHLKRLWWQFGKPAGQDGKPRGLSVEEQVRASPTISPIHPSLTFAHLRSPSLTLAHLRSPSLTFASRSRNRLTRTPTPLSPPRASPRTQTPPHVPRGNALLTRLSLGATWQVRGS